jgi:phosphate transport system permease protein
VKERSGLATSDATSLQGKGRGALSDKLFRNVTVVAVVLVLAILALIAISTTHEAWPAFRESGLDFFTSKTWIPNDSDGTGPLTPQFGALAFIYGTAVVSLIAIAIAVPVSVGIALFSTELAPRRLRALLVTGIDLMAAIPSVVYGLWGIAVLAPNITGSYDWWARTVKPVPVLHTLFGEGGTGRSFMTAGIILAIMITPIITSLTREVFNTVPRGEKDAALALGATRWEMIRGAVFPHSFGGVAGATMLGLGRAMGETIAVALTIGSSPQIVANLLKSGDAMPAAIANQFGESSGDFRAALIGLGVALFAITIAVNMTARVAVSRYDVRLKGAR